MNPKLSKAEYAQLETLGYRIDTRGIYPVLIHGLQTWTFETERAAYNFALARGVL